MQPLCKVRFWTMGYDLHHHQEKRQEEEKKKRKKKKEKKKKKKKEKIQLERNKFLCKFT